MLRRSSGTNKSAGPDRSARPYQSPATRGANRHAAPGSNLPAEVAGSMDEIQQQIIDLRACSQPGIFIATCLPPTSCARTAERFRRDNTPKTSATMWLCCQPLGLLEADFDLGTFYTNLLSEQIAGYYDDETKEMYVVGEQFSGMERLTYSHEYVHALQDQNYDIANGLQYDTSRASRIRSAAPGCKPC